MTPAELYALFRSDVVDERLPYFWTPTEVYAYMTDAEAMFCRLTGGLQDSSSALTELDVVAGEKTAALSSRILFIRGASLRSTERDVRVLNYEDLSRADNSRQYTRQFMDQAGPVTSIVLGMDEGTARLVQVPEADDTIDLVIERLPLRALTAESTKLEIAEQHHFHLLAWMERCAYLKQDSETFDKAKSAEKERVFAAYCAGAKAEKERRKHKPRLIAYGGI